MKLPSQSIIFATALSCGAFLCLASCTEDLSEDPPGVGSNKQDCTFNSDCPNGLVCGRLSGECEQCFFNNQCGVGLKCSPAGQCVTQCKEDRDCDQGTCKEGMCVDEQGQPTNPFEDIQDQLEDNGLVDEEGNVIPPKVGDTTVYCTEEQYDQTAEPCMVYLCVVCDCYGIDNYNCLDAAGKEDPELCRQRVDEFVCHDGESPFGGGWGDDDTGGGWEP